MRKNQTAVRIPTEPFSPNGLFRGRNGVPLIRSRLRLLAGAVWWVRRYIRKRNGFPNRLRLQVVTGWVVCRVLCINAERVVVRICHGRGCWQAVRSAGLGSTGGCGCVFAGRQVCGQNRIPHRFPKCPHTYGVRNPEPPSAFLPSPSALTGCFASGTVSHVIGRGCWWV